MISLKLRFVRKQNRIYTFVLKVFSLFTPNGPKIYLFHDLIVSKEHVKSKFEISQDTFETFLQNELYACKKAITFEELSDMILGKSKMQPDTFFVSFDDANESVFTKAYPFLKSLNIPFIIFITKELIGKKNFLNSEQIIELSNDPLCTVGSHGMNHVMFRYLSVEDSQKDMYESKVFLEELIGKPVSCFAFPYGRLVESSCENIKSLSESVYNFAFSAINGTLSQQWITSKFFLPRINVDEKYVNKKT